ncbi:cell wall hydrolase [Paenibacillus daejeonensis]|uniref:cell wall hydrolase n=1 Tax=Paenibacillus daejeonensis TaxID=135193 RepID=UPI00036859D0|nr:cell wall hydrolase [Paenibacillus daejeonensis]
MKFTGKMLGWCVLMASMVVAPVAASAAPVTVTKITVDGTEISTPAALRHDRMMVPAVLFNQLGAQVSWNTQYRSAVVRQGSLTLAFSVHRSYSNFVRGQGQWQSDPLGAPAFLQGGRAFVPLAYTAEKLGMTATYDAGSRTVSLRTSSGNYKPQSIANINRVSATAEDMKWLYRITEAEAGGESYTGKVAVAASIINRVLDTTGYWPDTLKDTIFHVTTYNGKSYYQYSPVLDKRIYDAVPSAETIRAVDEAMTGSDPSKGALVFFNPDKTDNQWVRSRPVTIVIGNHVFTK